MQPATKPCKYCKSVKEGMESYKCDKCYSLSHLACMKCKKPSRLKGDFLFLYECKDCNFQKKDVLTRMKLSWVQVIHMALYNLTVNERGRQGFFKWKEEICSFIDKHWSTLMPGKSKPPTWIGTIAGTLSVHSHSIFKSGQVFFNETGWWALQEVSIPKANPENYRVNRPVKNPSADLRTKLDISNITPEYGRGKRQRKSKEKFEEAPNTKVAKVEPSGSKPIISPADCVKSIKIKKESFSESSEKAQENTQIANTNTKAKSSNSKPINNTLELTDKSDFRPINSGCAIMAELSDAAYCSTVHVEDPFASLFDDMSVFNVPNSLLKDQSPIKQNIVEPPLPVSVLKIKMEPVEEPMDQRTDDIPEVLCKPLESLKSIKPIEKVNNVKPLTISEETEFLAKLNEYPLTINSDCSVRRLRRKLLNRKMKREMGIPLFSIRNGLEKQSENNDNQTETSPKADNLRAGSESAKVEKQKPSFHHPALIGVNVLDKFCNFFRQNAIHIKTKDTNKLISLIGISENTGGYQNSIVSPYTSRILKPYIRRDFSNLPTKLKVLRDIQKRCSIPMHRKWPIDYCYVQPMHIPAVNSLCSDFFWPGIDITECLQYPEFSCVVMYRKLLIGFAFMVPDVKFNEAYISFILVHPDWRRSGIATNMIYHLIQTCMGKDITLHVSPSNPSMLLYQKFGFKAEALILDFYKKYLPEEDTSSKHAFLLRLQR